MAEGDKIFIADKQTLDDVNSKVGTTGNTGGTTAAGTIFGKLNAIISSIASFVANWTAARAAKVDNLDATVSSRQSEANASSRYNTLNTNTGVNNTASATGTLSQKLSHIINLFTASTPKRLVSKAVNVNISTAGTHTLVNVTGGGQFEFARSDMGDSANPITFEIDGNRYTLNTLYQGYTRGSAYIGQSVRSPGNIVYQAATGDPVNDVASSIRPIHFKNSLKITVTTLDTTQHSFAANYAVYE